MLSYRRLCLLAAALLAVEFVAGLAGEIPPRHEIFPFASWFLFAEVPHQTAEYDLEFRAVDDRPLAVPLRFSRAGGLVHQPHSIVAFQVIQQFGQALTRHNAADLPALRRQIDALCGPGRLRYDVVAIIYDPVPRYDTGAVLSRRVLGTFTTREP